MFVAVEVNNSSAFFVEAEHVNHLSDFLQISYCIHSSFASCSSRRDGLTITVILYITCYEDSFYAGPCSTVNNNISCLVQFYLILEDLSVWLMTDGNENRVTGQFKLFVRCMHQKI